MQPSQNNQDQPKDIDVRSDTQPTQPVTTTQEAKKPISTTKALLIMFAPGLLIVATIFFYALSNFIFNDSASTPAVIQSLINIVLFLVGAISVSAALPCFIIGIILLARR